VKLFGDPVRESGEFAARADRVRDIGVRTSMLQSTFMNSLTLMSALALALVYGLGGVLAIGGHLEAGAIVSLALLLTRLYAPLTALANAHVEIASALVSFDRVFEVLDLTPLIRQRPGAVPVPDGPVAVEFDDVRFGYPSADKVSLASLEEVAVLDDRGGDEVLHGFRSRPCLGRWSPSSGPPARASRPSPRWWHGSTTSTLARCGCPAPTSAT
jgi:ABC-type multidrug transport system fused ATPase/permease subunit